MLKNNNERNTATTMCDVRDAFSRWGEGVVQNLNLAQNDRWHNHIITYNIIYGYRYVELELVTIYVGTIITIKIACAYCYRGGQLSKKRLHVAVASLVYNIRTPCSRSTAAGSVVHSSLNFAYQKDKWDTKCVYTTTI